jgi:hypothetical protein
MCPAGQKLIGNIDPVTGCKKCGGTCTENSPVESEEPSLEYEHEEEPSSGFDLEEPSLDYEHELPVGEEDETYDHEHHLDSIGADEEDHEEDHGESGVLEDDHLDGEELPGYHDEEEEEV